MTLNIEIETIFRSETGHVEIYRRADGQARLVLRKPGFTGNVRAEVRDIDDEDIAGIIEAAKAAVL